MRKRTVAELREDAKVILPAANLEQVYAIHTSMQVHNRHQATPLQCETTLLVKGQQIDDHIEAWARYDTTASADGDDGEPIPVWTVVLECVATFGLSDSELAPTEDQLEAFALLVGTPALHPYARAWTQTLTSHTQYPAFTLGLLDSLAELDPDHVITLPERTND